MNASTPTTEQFSQRVAELGLINERDFRSLWASLSSRDVPLQEFTDGAIRRGLLTNYQVDRLLKGETAGFFYGDYKVLYFCGNGSFARVYRAAHKETGDVFALKVLRKRHSESAVETERFLREGKMGEKLRHPNIVPIHEVHSSGRSHFLVMDFVEGQSLRDFCKLRKVVDPLTASKIVSGIVAGLAYASAQDVTHRDIKLSNILISSDGVPQLVDFGLASVISSGNDAHSNTRTIDYAALEKATGVPKDDPRSDIFFTGCMFYQMLTGESPIGEPRERSQRMDMSRFRQITPIRKVLPNLPLTVERTVNRAMELNVEERYDKPALMLVDLRKAIKQMEEESVGGGVEEKEEKEPTVLLMESSPKIQDPIRAYLKKHGFRVLVISDPKRCLRRLTDEQGLADVVICSTAVLGIDAMEFFRAFSASDDTNKIPLVLLMGQKQIGSVKESQLLPNQRIITMPLKAKELLRSVNDLSGRSAAK